MSQETTSLIARQGHCALGHIAAFCTLFVCTNEIDTAAQFVQIALRNQNFMWHKIVETYWCQAVLSPKFLATGKLDIQVILFEIDCAIFYTNLHELFCQLIN